MRHYYFLSLLFGAIILAAIFLIIIGNMQKRAIVSFESEPESEVYVNNRKIGTTPIEFETNEKTIVISIKDMVDSSLLPYETALSLTPHTKTIVRHNFGASEESSTNQIMQLKNNPKNLQSVTIVSNPENVNVLLDGNFVGATPLRISPPQGVHDIILSKDGYTDMPLKIESHLGYDLSISSDLATKPEALDPPLSSGQTATILKNKYGYVSVRKALGGSVEISRAITGREYEILGFNDTKSWLQIKLNASESGWILSSSAAIR